MNVATAIGKPTRCEISATGRMSFSWVRAAQFGLIFSLQPAISRASRSTSATARGPAPGGLEFRSADGIPGVDKVGMLQGHSFSDATFEKVYLKAACGADRILRFSTRLALDSLVFSRITAQQTLPSARRRRGRIRTTRVSSSPVSGRNLHTSARPFLLIQVFRACVRCRWLLRRHAELR